MTTTQKLTPKQEKFRSILLDAGFFELEGGILFYEAPRENISLLKAPKRIDYKVVAQFKDENPDALFMETTYYKGFFTKVTKKLMTTNVLLLRIVLKFMPISK